MSDKKSFQTERIALFSDAVFAIAVTLLVIEIKAPVVVESNPAEYSHAFWESMREKFPEFLGFFISFVVIATYWRGHHLLLGYLKDYNRKLISINNWLLFTIICMPFSTKAMSSTLAFDPYALYCCNIVISTLMMIRLWKYISNPANHLCDTIPEGVLKFKKASYISSIAGILLSVLMNLFFGGLIARCFLFTIFLSEMILGRKYRKKYGMGNKI